jgi:hypothetical protein
MAAPLSPLVIDLKREHADIIQAMAELRVKIASPDDHGDFLAPARDLLLAHLKKEDDQFYGVLFAKAQHDPHLARTLEDFAKDMQQISAFAINFFTVHRDGTRKRELSHDFSKLISLLGDRILREEIVLYPAYDLAVQS